MKPDIHPEYRAITVVLTDGSEVTMRSTLNSANARLALDIDPRVHPAWTKQHRLVDRGTQLAKFNKRFAGLSAKKEATETSAAEPKEKIKLTTTGKKKS